MKVGQPFAGVGVQNNQIAVRQGKEDISFFSLGEKKHTCLVWDLAIRGRGLKDPASDPFEMRAEYFTNDFPREMKRVNNVEFLLMGKSNET